MIAKTEKIMFRQGPGCVHIHSTCSHQEPTMDVFIRNLKNLPQLYDVFQSLITKCTHLDEIVSIK